MSVTVIVPTLLRPHAGGRREVLVDGDTIAAVIGAVDEMFPGFSGAVLEADGSIKRYLAVFIGNDDVRYLRGAATRVPDGSEVIVLPAVAGGALLEPHDR